MMCWETNSPWDDGLFFEVFISMVVPVRRSQEC
jgi:hypothetical protein